MTEQLREKFRSDGVIRIVGSHNALGAKLAEGAGFDGVWASGLEISTSFAVPDANILTMSQYLSVASDMADAVQIPVVADCDTGYGNSNNVIHMVKKYEAAGIAAVCMEDKFFPKVNSFIPGRQKLASIGEFVGKILAAKNAQRDPDFMVIARVEALIAGWGQDEAMKRARAYRDAGADAILMHSKSKDPEEVGTFLDAWEYDTPVVVVPTTYFSISAQGLLDRGAKMVIYANQGLRASITAMGEAYKEIIQSGSTASIEERITPMKTVFELQGMLDMKKDEAIYLRTGSERTRAIIPGAGDHLEERSLKHIASEIPMAMLDINGKPLLQRQMEILNLSGVGDVTFISGYRSDLLGVDGVKVATNPDWKSTGEMKSIGCADPAYDGRTLLAYSDILFDQDALAKLLGTEAGIAIMVDRTYDSKADKLDRMADLVELKSAPAHGRRSLERTPGRVVKIGKKVPADQANCEFAGLALFDKSGFERLLNVYREVLTKHGNKPFHEASSPVTASLTDMLQELINQGEEVVGVEVSSGWMEIHSFNDYKLACEIVPA